MKRIAALLLVLALCFACFGCDKGRINVPPDGPDGESETGEQGGTDLNHLMPVAVFTMDGGAQFEVELYKETAPKTVENFTKLIKSGFYDGTLIHRIASGNIHIIQSGGEFLGEDNNRYSKYSDAIFGEFAVNGFDNGLSHTEGVISMARTSDFNSASSQFFICFGDSTDLDGDYAAFGRVRKGMDVILEISETPRLGDAPLENIIIEKVTLKYVSK
ncbi:MAG TPA: peptidylprolyl isomerase [Clostridia bacterium]|jgi:peptidyl-prolyl cis-trans isomerase B (cyclophilin B)|nr:peptidylprolyl isomerase [Clostridia bacterium]